MGFTHRKLRDLENIAQKFGMPEEMESRFARLELGLENVALGYFTFAPGFRMPFGHRHVLQEEIYVVIAGSGRVKIDEEIVDVRQGDVLRVEPSSMRQFEAGPEGIEYLAFAAGDPDVSKTDAEMVPGWWTD